MTLVSDERLARRVGAITLVLAAAITAALVFLLDRVELRAQIRIRVVFRHSAGLHERAPLVVGGQPIGRIESISPVPHGAIGLLDGEVGVAATVAIDRDSAWKVPAASTIFVASRGALSDKYLEVAPPRGDPGPAVHDGQEFRGIDPPSLDTVLQHTWANLTTFKRFADAVRPELTALRSEVDRLRTQLDGVARDPRAAGGVGTLAVEAAGLYATARTTYDQALGGDAGLAAMRAMVSDARQTIAALRAALAVLEPRFDAVAAGVDHATSQLAARAPLGHAREVIATVRGELDRIEPLLAAIAELGDRLARGEGSLGRLMTDPEFPEDTKDLGKIMKRHPWRIMEHGRE